MLNKFTKLSILFLTLLMCFGAFGGCAELVDEINNALSSELDTQSAAESLLSQEGSDSSTQEVSEEISDVVSEETQDVSQAEDTTEESSNEESSFVIDEDGTYTSANDVALYIHTYNRLPNNFITKNEARALGWEGGGVEKYAPGKCIGGDRFGNYEGLLPEKNGRTYTECDIDTLGANSRGAKRIVFSNDGLVYYTDDHYETFTLLYGEE